MSQSNDVSNASRYRKLLKQCAEGVCLWYPDTVGIVGDCGYVYEGSFNKVGPTDWERNIYLHN